MYNSIIILGPTASGKTGLSVALAKSLNSSIISADSVQIYKKFDIGSAKVTLDEMQGVKHYMIDVVEPTENFTVSQYKDMALKIAKDLINKGEMPIIVGGTGFYLSSLITEQNYGNCPPNDEIREKYNKLYQQKGADFVFSKLVEIDPKTAQKLHKNDQKRVVRALEIYEVTGKTKSDWEEENKIYKTKSDLKPLIIGLNLSTRQALYDKINLRVDIMFNSGLLNEVKNLRNLGLDLTNQPMQAIGYKEFFDYFNGLISLEDVKENIKKNTRHYAKRQLTYFNQFSIDKWFNIDKVSIDEIIEEIKSLLK